LLSKNIALSPDWPTNQKRPFKSDEICSLKPINSLSFKDKFEVDVERKVRAQSLRVFSIDKKIVQR
jgi:hypothetical protein